MIIRPAASADLRAIDALRRANAEAVGFVPLARWQEQLQRDARCLLTGWENADLVAYIYWTPGLPVAAIQQVVVREDARKSERGREIVTAAAEIMQEDPQRFGVTCRCRVDLESTAFWEALGFVLCRLENTGGRRGPAARYYKALRPALMDLGPYLPQRYQSWGSRTGFRWTPNKETAHA